MYSEHLILKTKIVQTKYKMGPLELLEIYLTIIIIKLNICGLNSRMNALEIMSYGALWPPRGVGQGGWEGDAKGRRYGDICICIADLLYYTAEPNTSL